MKKRISYSLITFICLTFISCKYDKIPIEPVPEVVSFQLDVQPIFDNDCIICHNGGFIAPSDFRADVSFDEIKNKFLVVPGNLEASNLYQRLIGNANLMPPGSPISQSKIDIIAEWIVQGALNN